MDHADVVVISGGGSSLTTAITAANAGARVVPPPRGQTPTMRWGLDISMLEHKRAPHLTSEVRRMRRPLPRSATLPVRSIAVGQGARP